MECCMHIRIFNGCEVQIEYSVPKLTRLMLNSYPEWQNFQFSPNSHYGFFFLPGLPSNWNMHYYRNDPKFSDTQNICCNHSKVWTMCLYHRLMSPNDADGMANSVDPDQTAPLGAVWSGSALFVQAYLSENLGSLRYALLYQFFAQITMVWSKNVSDADVKMFVRKWHQNWNQNIKKTF